MLLLVACGGSAGSQSPSTPAAAPGAASATTPTAATASQPGAAASVAASGDNGPIGGDVGNRAKGSVKAQVTGGLTTTIDLPFGAPLARFEVDGDGTAYLPFTDPAGGTLFLTISAGNSLLVQYAGPDSVGLSNGASPCTLTLTVLDTSQAKGSFACKGMMLIRPDSLGSADISGTFEGHR
jgi:hypothetical protein